MKGSLLKEGDYGYWSKRSLELSNARLKYWRSANGDGEPLCDISLAGSSLSNPKSARSGKFAFRLDVPSGGKFNKFVLAGDTQADTARWVEAFRAQGVVINFEVSAPAVTIEQSNRSVDDDDDEGEEEPMLPSDSARSDSQSQASRSVCQSPRGSTSAPAPEASGSGTPRFRAAPGSSSKVPGLPSAAAGVSLAMTPVPPSVSKSASPLSPSRIGRQMTPRTPHTSLRNAYEEVLWLRFKREDLLQNHGGFHVSELTVDARQIDDEGAFFDEEKGSDNADGGAKKKEGEKEGKEAEGRKRTCLSSWSACFQEEEKKAKTWEDAELQPEQGPSSLGETQFRSKEFSGAVKIGEGEALAVTEKCELKLTGDGWTISAWWSTDSIKAEEEHVLASSRKGNFHCYFKRGRPCAGKKSVDFDATSRVDTTKPWHHIVAVVSAPKKRPRADSKAGRAAREEAMRATASGGVPPADPELGSTTFYIDGELVGSVKQAVVEPIALIGNDEHGDSPIGFLADTRVFMRELSEEEVVELYEQHAPELPQSNEMHPAIKTAIAKLNEGPSAVDEDEEGKAAGAEQAGSDDTKGKEAEEDANDTDGDDDNDDSDDDDDVASEDDYEGMAIDVTQTPSTEGKKQSGTAEKKTCLSGLFGGSKERVQTKSIVDDTDLKLLGDAVIGGAFKHEVGVLALRNVSALSERSLNAFFGHLSVLSALQIVDIGGSKEELTDSGRKIIYDVQVHDHGAQLLCEALQSAGAPVKQLVLRFNFIGDQGAKAIAGYVKGSETIKKLDLESNEVGDDGAKELARALTGHKSLKDMFLEDNIIGDLGAKAFARSIRVLKSDLTLQLINNNVGDEGAIAFAAAFVKNTDIREGTEVIIDLTRNNVGDDGARALYRALKDKQKDRYESVTIDLSDCSVSAAFKVTNKLERDFGLFAWSEKYDEKKLFKIWGRASRIRGWLLVTGQLLAHGMDTLIPDGDEDRLEILRKELRIGRELTNPSCPTLSYIACPIIFALRVRTLCAEFARVAETGEEEAVAEATQRVEKYAISLLETADTYKANWDDEHPAINLLEKVEQGKDMFEVALECSAYDFMAHPVANACVEMVWKAQWRPYQKASTRMTNSLSLRNPLQSVRVLLRRATAPYVRFLTSFVLQLAFVVLTVTVSDSMPFAYEVSWLERAFLVFAVAFAVAEAQQVLGDLIRGRIGSYLSDIWNMIDLLIISMLAVVVGLRAAALMTPLEERVGMAGYAFASDGASVLETESGREISWPEYKLSSAAAGFDPVLQSGEGYLDLAQDVFGLVAMLSLIRLMSALTLFASFGPLIVMISRMMGDLAVFLVLYGVGLLGFAVLFKALFAKGEQFSSLGATGTWLFYAAFTGGEPDDLSVRIPLIANLALSSWLILASLIMLNLLIAMFADSYSAIKERSKTVYKYKSAALKYEFARVKGLPPPLNIASLPFELFGWVVRQCRRVIRNVEPEMPTISDDWIAIVKTVRAKLAKAQDAEEDDAQAAVLSAVKKIEGSIEELRTRMNKLSDDMKRQKERDAAMKVLPAGGVVQRSSWFSRQRGSTDSAASAGADLDLDDDDEEDGEEDEDSDSGSDDN